MSTWESTFKLGSPVYPFICLVINIDSLLATTSSLSYVCCSWILFTFSMLCRSWTSSPYWGTVALSAVWIIAYMTFVGIESSSSFCERNSWNGPSGISVGQCNDKMDTWVLVRKTCKKFCPTISKNNNVNIVLSCTSKTRKLCTMRQRRPLFRFQTQLPSNILFNFKKPYSNCLDLAYNVMYLIHTGPQGQIYIIEMESNIFVIQYEH